VHALAATLSEPLDLVVSDVMLPGQHGPELVALLRRRHPDTKCLYTSGYAAALAGERGGLEVDEPFLAKPFTMAELASLVREVLDN
jgi:CheY-like chemotaxis protein